MFLGQMVSIDESMIPFKGQIGFRQFIASKRVRFGIKVWGMAESLTGYVSQLQIYTGRERETDHGEQGLASRIVNDLVVPYENMGYHLYVDNFYTNPALFEPLYERLIYACGTLRCGRKGFPVDIKINDPKRHNRGFSNWSMCGPILAQFWLHGKAAYFLSTIHKPEYDPDVPQTNQVVKRRGAARTRDGIEVSCPPLLHDYNIAMGGVDFNDHQQKFYNLGRRSTRWYRRVFFYLLEIALHNTFVVKNASLSRQY